MVARSARRRSAGARSQAGRRPNSTVMSGLARAGLAARGVMYGLIGIIAVEIALGTSHQQADRSGAVQLVAATPFGKVILWLLVIGFAGLTLWRLSEAHLGRRGPGRPQDIDAPDLPRQGRHLRLLTYSILKYALGLGAPVSSNSQSRDLTATALKYPGGQVAVAIAGVIVVGHRPEPCLPGVPAQVPARLAHGLGVADDAQGRDLVRPGRRHRPWRRSSSRSGSSWSSRPRSQARPGQGHRLGAARARPHAARSVAAGPGCGWPRAVRRLLVLRGALARRSEQRPLTGSVSPGGQAIARSPVVTTSASASRIAASSLARNSVSCLNARSDFPVALDARPVSVVLPVLGEQDQRGRIRGLGRERQVEQDERVGIEVR